MQLKYHIFLIIATIALILFGVALGDDTTYNAREVVGKVVSQYKLDTGFNGNCTIGGEPHSLEGIVMGKISQESAYGTKGMGSRYNNWGNLKYARSRPLPKQTDGSWIHGDGGQYYTYKSVEDGIYDIAERTKRRGSDSCSVTYESVFIYIKGGRNGIWEDKYVRAYYNNMTSVAKAYDMGSNFDVVKNKETESLSDGINGIESFYRNAKAAEERAKQHESNAALQLKKAKREWNEAKKMRGKCIQKGIECKQ